MKKEKDKKISFRVSLEEFNLAQELKEMVNLSEIFRAALKKTAKTKGIA